MNIQHIYALYQQSRSICTDSRKVTDGCVFFALKGDHFDANQFAAQAIQQGAACAVIDDPQYAHIPHTILVANTLQCLQQLAKYHRKQLNIPVLAITGSNGKTTTKELVNAVLSTQYKTHATQGNLNNHIGVPLTLLSMPTDTQIAIVEMGANHVGEIADLCQIALPTHGIITNIGKAHLEGFGGIKGVIKAKSELYRYLEATNGVAFVNATQAYLPTLAEGIARTIWYGRDSETLMPLDTKGEYEIQKTDNLSFKYVTRKDGEWQTICTQIYGGYNFNNALAAVAVGQYFGVTDSNMLAGIEHYIPTNNRSQVVHIRNQTYIMDAYNANPTSMMAALENFASLAAENKGVILGDMLELGADTASEHQKIVTWLLAHPSIKYVYLVGTYFGATTRNSAWSYASHVAQLNQVFYDAYQQPTTWLIKGSRGIGLEKFREVANNLPTPKH
jgi:UDP-N-acetylmuramoyl-tripeptide--D-alanyl-D-alanine ligase